MTRALIIVDHGSQVDEANRMLEAVAMMLRTASPDPVYAAHMELAEPTIAQAFNTAVSAGADFIFVFPYFLSPGRHSREDIPRLCAEAARAHPNVRWHCSGPFGLDEALRDLVLHRVERCEANEYDCDKCPDRTICDPDLTDAAQRRD